MTQTLIRDDALSPYADVYNQNVSPNRWQFLLESMSDVSESIKSINPKSQLFVLRGPPTTVLPALFKTWKITHLVFERDDDPYTIERDTTVQKLADEAGVEVITELGRTLYEPAEIKKKAPGKTPTSMGPFVKLVESLPDPPDPIDAPTSLPDPGPTDLKNWKRADHSVDSYRRPEIDVNARHRDEEETSYETFSGPNGDFAVPTMKEIGMEGKATTPHHGGEKNGLKILDDYLKDKKKVLNFKKPETSPAAFEPASSAPSQYLLSKAALTCARSDGPLAAHEVRYRLRPALPQAPERHLLRRLALRPPSIPPRPTLLARDVPLQSSRHSQLPPNQGQPDRSVYGLAVAECL